MASITTFSPVETLRLNATRVEPLAMCPQVAGEFPLSESETEKHAESMTDEELALHVESKLRPVGESLRNNIAYIREARERFAHPGRRVPVFGQPTFTQWIRKISGSAIAMFAACWRPPKNPLIDPAKTRWNRAPTRGNEMK
jgi:hypothetical protein